MTNVAVWTGTSSPGLLKPKSIGYKFKEDGTAEYFDANTIICHIDHDSVLFEKLTSIRSELLALPFSHKFAFMPPSSYHMTLFVGCNDRMRTTDEWSNLFDLNASIEDVTEVFADKLAELQGVSSLYIMKPKAIISNGSGCVTLMLDPSNDEQAKALAKSRDLISEATGVRRNDHEQYQYHITFSYQLDWLTEQEARELDELVDKLFSAHFRAGDGFEITNPQLCRLFSMNQFDPVVSFK